MRSAARFEPFHTLMVTARASFHAFLQLAVILAAMTVPGSEAFADPTQSAETVTREMVMSAPPKLKFSDWQEVDQLSDGTEYLETFPSPVVTGDAKNDLVPLRVFVPYGAAGPTHLVVIAHYWGATDLKAESALAADLNERGISAAILTLPYHMERTPIGAKSGAMAVRPDPALLKLMMYQSEQDARRAMDFLDTRPEFVHGDYGFAGISLGALVAELTFALDTRISSATFALGGADFAHIVWSSSRVVLQKEVLRRAGWTEAKLRRELEAVEPLTYLPRSDHPKSFVIEAKYDTVVPRQSTEELISKLSDPVVSRLSTGHYGGIFVEGKVLRTVSDFFSTTVAGRTYAAPAHLSSPTLRIGALVGFPQGADLGAGIDIFHLDSGGSRFGTIFLTPRGLRFFLGQSLGSGFSAGFVGSSTGVGAGLMWSIIL
jgi:hypothetical protein